MCMCKVYDHYFTCMAQVSGLSCGCCPCPRAGSPSATITFLPCRHHVESSSGVCQPQLQPQPVSSAASTSCLQEGPTSNTFFHFLCCSLCFRVEDYSRPVAMTDCCCCCPSPYWPHKIVQQSTGLLKPLIECMVHSTPNFCSFCKSVTASSINMCSKLHKVSSKKFAKPNFFQTFRQICQAFCQIFIFKKTNWT